MNIIILSIQTLAAVRLHYHTDGDRTLQKILPQSSLEPATNVIQVQLPP